MTDKISGIYVISNKYNDKDYIGSSKNIWARKSQHFSDLKLNKHGNSHLQRDYNEFGKCGFTFNILELCDESSLLDREQYWLDFLHPKYNVNELAGNHIGSYIHTEEAKEKRRKTMAGKKYGPRKPYVWKAGHAPNKGKTFGEEFREKIRQAVSGEKNPNFGKPRSEETRKKISDANFKYYDGLIDPDGKVYAPITRLSDFCLEHNLCLSKAVAVLRGKIKHHKGWTKYIPE